MEKKSKSWIIIVLLLIIIFIILGVLCYLFATKTIIINSQEEVNNQEEDNIKYNVNDYISIEKESFKHESFDISKVTFKNLDSDLTKDFLEKQEEMIESSHNYDETYGSDSFGETYYKTTKLLYQINNNILTVYYETESGSSGAGSEYSGCKDVNVINIDLENNKLLTGDDVLKLASSSFLDIATDEYEKTLNWLNQDSENSFTSIDNKEIYYEEFAQNKETYIDMISSDLDDAINVYIEDGKVKYEYMIYSIELSYQTIIKDGCHAHDTITVGNIN